jgi:hypothetical protein
MFKVRLAAVAIIALGSALLTRPAQATYRPPVDDGAPQYCCCTMTLFGCGNYCCSKNGCTSSASGCTVQPS